MITVDVDGLRLAARTAGDPGRPGLVLLHGWPQSGRAFEGVIDALGNDHQVMAFEFRSSLGGPSSIRASDGR